AATPVVEYTNGCPGTVYSSAVLIGWPAIAPVPPVGFVTTGPFENSTSPEAIPAAATSPATAVARRTTMEISLQTPREPATVCRRARMVGPFESEARARHGSRDG